MHALLQLFLMLLALPAAAQDFTTLKGHGGPIMGLDMSAAGQLASASFDNSVGLWQDQTPRWLEGHDAAVSALKYLSNDVLLSGGDDFNLRIWDGPDSRVIGAHKGKINAIATGPDAQTVATASWDGRVGLWLLAASDAAPKWNAIGKMLEGHSGAVNAVAFSADGTRLYSASSDGTIRLWEDGGNSSRVLVNNGFGINKLILTNDWLAYGAVDGVTRVIDPETGTQLADFTLERRPILSMEYHMPTSQLAVGDGQGFIMVIDTDDWRIARDFRAMRRGPAWALAFSQDGQMIYAGGLDDVIYAWPVPLLDLYDPVGGETRSFLRNAGTMPNGERQFMRKCSICHALTPGPSRKAGPSLHGVFGRRAGTVPGYRYSDILNGSEIIWGAETIDALFDQGPDHYIPGSKMPMQVISQPSDRADLVAFLKHATQEE